MSFFALDSSVALYAEGDETGFMFSRKTRGLLDFSTSTQVQQSLHEHRPEDQIELDAVVHDGDEDVIQPQAIVLREATTASQNKCRRQSAMSAATNNNDDANGPRPRPHARVPNRLQRTSTRRRATSVAARGPLTPRFSPAAPAPSRCGAGRAVARNSTRPQRASLAERQSDSFFQELPGRRRGSQVVTSTPPVQTL